MTGRAGAALLGWSVARAAAAALSAAPPGGAARWQRTNHRGRRVSLLGGPVVAVAATLAATAGAPPGRRRTTAALGLTCALVGGYDDLAGSPPGRSPNGAGSARTDKGFTGHLAALRDGRLSTGAMKLAVVGTAGLFAGVRIGSGPVDAITRGGVIAGTANLVNLLDLRPGRALKAVGVIGLPLLAGPRGAAVAGLLGAVAAVLPADLGERLMIGDTGANPLGALLGLALAQRGRPVHRGVLLAVLLGLNLASERVSFTRVIEATPGLREFDALGRVPAADRPAAR